MIFSLCNLIIFSCDKLIIWMLVFDRIIAVGDRSSCVFELSGHSITFYFCLKFLTISQVWKWWMIGQNKSYFVSNRRTWFQFPVRVKYAILFHSVAKLHFTWLPYLAFLLSLNKCKNAGYKCIYCNYEKIKIYERIVVEHVLMHFTQKKLIAKFSYNGYNKIKNFSNSDP